MIKSKYLLVAMFCAHSFVSLGQMQDYSGTESHAINMSDHTTLNIFIDYTIQKDGLARIDSVYGGYTGWVFNLYIEPARDFIVQNWDQVNGQMVWEQTFTTGVGKSYESALFNQVLSLEGALQVRGVDTGTMEVVSLLYSNPRFDTGVKVFYFFFVSHILLMIISALVTLFQTKYGSVRKLIISALFPFVGPAIYLGVGLYKLIKHMVNWAKGLNASATE